MRSTTTAEIFLDHPEMKKLARFIDRHPSAFSDEQVDQLLCRCVKRIAQLLLTTASAEDEAKMMKGRARCN